ncbi:MAG: HAMP domain-containing sensor histidine kinase [Chloroflexota bacterium]
MRERYYSRELSADTSSIVIPIITGLSFLVCLGVVAFNPNWLTHWHYWLVITVYPISSYIAWFQIQNDRIERGNVIFIVTTILLIFAILANTWEPNSQLQLPYLFGVVIIITSMTLKPEISFSVWVVTSLLSVLAVGIQVEPFTYTYIYSLFWPIVINFFLALTAYLVAYEWRFAVESISELHRKVRYRRNELFEIQEELQQSNSILRSLNEEIERARQVAIEEKEIRTRFMNTVSHELRTPLNSIVNFAHILSQGVRGPLTEGQVDYLSRIQHSGWHLLAVLNDLLDIAQIEAGEFDLKYAPTNLHLVCEEAMNNTTGLQLDNNISVVRNYPDRWPIVKADPMRLQQAIINLLGNAFKYTKEGFVSLRVHCDESLVYISVEDSGIGIKEEDMGKIFDEFHQVDQSVARRRIGTGLGLSITKHLVERHGGTMQVESQVGKGSKFTIILPIWKGDTLNGSQPLTVSRETEGSDLE